MKFLERLKNYSGDYLRCSVLENKHIIRKMDKTVFFSAKRYNQILIFEVANFISLVTLKIDRYVVV